METTVYLVWIPAPLKLRRKGGSYERLWGVYLSKEVAEKEAIEANECRTGPLEDDAAHIEERIIS